MKPIWPNYTTVLQQVSKWVQVLRAVKGIKGCDEESFLEVQPAMGSWEWRM